MSLALTSRTAAPAALSIVAFVLIGFNLRPGLSSVAPLLPQVVRDLGLTPSGASILTMLPILCLGLFGPFAERLAGRFGLGKVITGFLLLLVIGLTLRVIENAATFFLATAIIGTAIGMTGVLMPAVARLWFPQKIGLMMGIHTMSLCLGAASAAGLSGPIALLAGETTGVAGWAAALSVWAIPALAATLLWASVGQHVTSSPRSESNNTSSLWRNPLAWQVTGFMAAQSSLAFVTFGWLPVILQDRGLTAIESGVITSLSIMAQAVSALLVPTLAARNRQQSIWAIGIMTCVATGLLGCIMAPTGSLIAFGLLLGLGQGGSFGLALTLIVLRTNKPQASAALSGMVQGIGSLIASLGPLLAGILRTFDPTWHLAAFAFTLIAVIAMILGSFAGRHKEIHLHGSDDLSNSRRISV
ncbi:MFS transporter [Rhizobium sp. RAF56]|uniref:MFS transporter n=1 Tax=Rhizobium sp. RAF56 TaxID=3233062 RepID=UPI003F98828F